eukprot:scaffold547308_cov23-Prasinocladus_malaysianus.AAC.1
MPQAVARLLHAPPVLVSQPIYSVCRPVSSSRYHEKGKTTKTRGPSEETYDSRSSLVAIPQTRLDNSRQRSTRTQWGLWYSTIARLAWAI